MFVFWSHWIMIIVVKRKSVRQAIIWKCSTSTKRHWKSNELTQCCTILSPKPSIPLQGKKSPQSSRGSHAMYNSRTHLWKRTSGGLSSSRACLLPDRAFSLDSSYTLFPSPFSLPSSSPFPPTIVSDNGRRGQLSSANKNHRSRHRVARYHHQQQQTVDQAKMPLAVAVVARSIKPKHRLIRSKQAV